MNRALELDMAVGLLTRRSKHRVEDADGSTAWVTAEPLLVQLRMAVMNSSAPAGFKASAGSALPLSADALDLLSEIAEDTADHWWKLHDRHHGQGRDTLAGQLRAWAMAARAKDEDLQEAALIICRWPDRIDGLLHPLRRWEIRGSCPECKAAEVLVQGLTGTVRMPALAVLYGQDGQLSHASCAACGTTWERLSMFARMIREQG